jgi:hypothetical protein
MSKVKIRMNGFGETGRELFSEKPLQRYTVKWL